MTRVICALVILAGLQQPPSVRGFDRFQEWARLVQAHRPGEFDASARTIANWSQADLSTVNADLWAVVTLTRPGSNVGESIQYTRAGEIIRGNARPTSWSRSMSMYLVPRVLSLPVDPATGEVAPAALTAFMKRATTLHTDIVMLAGRADVAGAPAAAVREATTRRVIDGEDGGWDAHPIHWELARYALDGVHPKPSDDALVAAWYHATSAYLIFRREYGYLTLHVLKGRELRPDDARLQFYSGVLHESYAGPQVQAALSLLTSGSFRPEVRSSVDELKQAEGFFRRALTLDSAMVHARVHLGRVIGLLGRHDEARTELTTALSSLSDRRQRYYAELFLGDTERRAGRGGEARAAYLRASELFPNAQAPRFGLSQVAWDEGDRSAAQESFRTMATLSQDDAKRDDPWWSYEVSSVLDVAELVDNLRRLAVEQLSR